MMKMTSGAAASDFDKALALIAGLSDPKAGADRLLELQAAEQKALAVISEAKAAHDAVAADKAAFDTAQAERAKNLDAREAEIARANEDLSRRKTLIDREDAALTMGKAALADDRKKHEAAVSQAKAEQDHRAAALDTRSKELDTRSDVLDTMAAGLDARANALAEKEAALEKRIAELNAALKPVRG